VACPTRRSPGTSTDSRHPRGRDIPVTGPIPASGAKSIRSPRGKIEADLARDVCGSSRPWSRARSCRSTTICPSLSAWPLERAADPGPELPVRRRARLLVAIERVLAAPGTAAASTASPLTAPRLSATLLVRPPKGAQAPARRPRWRAGADRSSPLLGHGRHWAHLALIYAVVRIPKPGSISA
jgi:hypothetical protein